MNCSELAEDYELYALGVLEEPGVDEDVAADLLDPRAVDLTGDSVWLDGLVSIREISHQADGAVRGVFTLKNGAEREASIGPLNRVLYIDGRFGRTEKLDLGRVTKIDFE